MITLMQKLSGFELLNFLRSSFDQIQNHLHAGFIFHSTTAFHRLNLANMSLICRYLHGKCSDKICSLIPLV